MIKNDDLQAWLTMFPDEQEFVFSRIDGPVKQFTNKYFCLHNLNVVYVPPGEKYPVLLVQE